MDFTHLQQRPSQRIYQYSDVLAARKDMVPCNLDANGKATTNLDAAIPVDAQPGMSSALIRLDSLESQLRDVISIIARIPGGAELLAQRESDVQVDLPPDKPAQVPTPPAAAPPPPAAAPVAPIEAPPAVATGQSELESATAELEAAQKKVAAGEKYLQERNKVAADAGAAHEKLLADRATGVDVTEAAIEEAGLVLKGARIKVKSATTKLSNAQRQLNDAQTELAALTVPAA